MGRIKKDHSNWKTMGLWKRFQYPKVEEESKKPKSKKNTKKWCKGKVGVKHDYKLEIPQNDPESIRGFRKVPICTNCRRQDYNGVLYKNKKTGVYEKHWLF